MTFDENVIQAVWEKAPVHLPSHPSRWRKDEYGAWIGRDAYGSHESEFGWKIDLIDPEGGSTELANLCALQWENHLSKQAGDRPDVVTAEAQHNVRNLPLAT